MTEQKKGLIETEGKADAISTICDIVINYISIIFLFIPFMEDVSGDSVSLFKIFWHKLILLNDTQYAKYFATLDSAIILGCVILIFVLRKFININIENLQTPVQLRKSSAVKLIFNLTSNTLLYGTFWIVSKRFFDTFSIKSSFFQICIILVYVLCCALSFVIFANVKNLINNNTEIANLAKEYAAIPLIKKDKNPFYIDKSQIVTDENGNILPQDLRNAAFNRYKKMVAQIKNDWKSVKKRITISVASLLLFSLAIPFSYALFYNEGRIFTRYGGFPYADVYDAEFGVTYTPPLIYYYNSNDKTFQVTPEKQTVVQEYHGSNYIYYSNKIEDLQKQLLETKSIGSDTSKIQQLSEEINHLITVRENLVYPYIYIKYSFWNEDIPTTAPSGVQTTSNTSVFKIEEIIYDTRVNDGESIKWGKSSPLLENIGIEEKLELEKNTFSQGTNFYNIKLGVKIFYDDGSMRLYYVNPENAEELTNASAGSYAFKWSDEWGSYSAPITIKN